MLGSSARIRRGFSRFGAIVGLSVVIALGVVEGIPAKHDWDQVAPAFEQARCIVAWAGNQKSKPKPANTAPATSVEDSFPPYISSTDIGCFGPMQGVSVSEAQRIISSGVIGEKIAWAQSWSLVAFGSLATAATVWLAFYLVGWAVSGFARD